MNLSSVSPTPIFERIVLWECVERGVRGIAITVSDQRPSPIPPHMARSKSAGEDLRREFREVNERMAKTRALESQPQK